MKENYKTSKEKREYCLKKYYEYKEKKKEMTEFEKIIDKTRISANARRWYRNHKKK